MKRIALLALAISAIATGVQARDNTVATTVQWKDRYIGTRSDSGKLEKFRVAGILVSVASERTTCDKTRFDFAEAQRLIELAQKHADRLWTPETGAQYENTTDRLDASLAGRDEGKTEYKTEQACAQLYMDAANWGMHTTTRITRAMRLDVFMSAAVQNNNCNYDSPDFPRITKDAEDTAAALSGFLQSVVAGDDMDELISAVDLGSSYGTEVDGEELKARCKKIEAYAVDLMKHR